jgi:hypothetical protein
MTRKSMSVKALRSLLPLLVLLAAACRKDGTAPEASYTLSFAGAEEQSAPAGAILPQPLEAIVRTASGAPVSGVIVEFAAVAGSSGSTEEAVAVSGNDGIARATVRLGSVVGLQEFDATIRRNRLATVRFRAVATEPPVLLGVSPMSFEGGDTLVISGARLLADGSPAVALVGGMEARAVAVEGDSVMRVVAPLCLPPGSVAVAVRTGSITTNTVSATYESSIAPLLLAVGEAATLRTANLGECVRLPETLGAYLITPQFLGTGVDEDGASFILGRDAATVPFSITAAGSTQPSVGPAQAFHDRLRELEKEIGPAVAAQPRVPQLARGASVTLPQLNSTRTFDVLNDLRASPVTFSSVTAALRYVGDNILVYIDTQAPSGFNGYSEADISSLGTLFDNEMYQIAATTFGRESDLDRNGRVIVLMSPVVNALVTAAECANTGFVAGFFYPNDLYLNNTGSNRGEIFYTIVPDPQGTFSCAHPVANVRRSVPGTFIHELQHMISFNERVLVRGGSSEDLWLNEALSIHAEELAGRHFNDKYPAPSGRTSASQLFADSARPFLFPVLANAYNYLANSQATSVTSFANYGSLEERGGAWLFLRWLIDQQGPQIVPRLVQTTASGEANVAARTGEPFTNLFGDFAIAASADLRSGFDRTSLAPRNRFTSYDLRTEFAYYASATGRNSSPINYTSILNDGSPRLSKMVRSTVGFYVLGKSDASLSVMLRFAQPDLAPLPSSLGAQLGIVRIQ